MESLQELKAVQKKDKKSSDGGVVNEQSERAEPSRKKAKKLTTASDSNMESGLKVANVPPRRRSPRFHES